MDVAALVGVVDGEGRRRLLLALLFVVIAIGLID